MKISNMIMASLIFASITVLGWSGETSKQCGPCADDYKSKAMPFRREAFCPTGCDTYQMKTGIPVKPCFIPNGCDDYKYKGMPCIKPNALGICFPDGGSGINFWGLRPRPDASHPNTNCPNPSRQNR